MTNPVEPFTQWYRAQHETVRSHICFFTRICIPGHEMKPPMPSLNGDKEFDEWLNQPMTNKFQAFGRVLYLREAVNLLGFRDRSTKEDWELHTEKLKGMMARMRAAGQGELADGLVPTVEGIPEQSELWIAAAQSWQQLCSSALSNESLEAWFDQAIK